MFLKNKTTYFLILSAAVLAGMCFFAWFIYGKIVKVSSVIKSSEAQIALLEEKEKEFLRITSEIDKSEDKIEKIKATFLKEETFVNFVELLESISEESGAKIKIESAKLPQAKDPANVIFSLEGNFLQIMRFFILFDYMPIAGLINNLEIAPKTIKTEENVSQDILFVKAIYTIFSFK